MVVLKEVDETSLEQCAALKCTQEQTAFANSPVWSLLQTAYTSCKDHCILYAIWHNDQVVGMVRLDFTLFSDCYMFTNLLIDKAYQRQHLATKAIQEIIRIFRQDGRHSLLKLHVAKENIIARALYEKCGFLCVGTTMENDVFLEYTIDL